MHTSQGTQSQDTCTADTTAIWQHGSYCIMQGSTSDVDFHDKTCPAGFQWGFVVIAQLNVTNIVNAHKGRVPAGEYYNIWTVYYLCCRDDGDVNRPIELPTQKPFILFPTRAAKACQAVKGMMVKQDEMFLDTADTYGDFPLPPMNVTLDYSIDHLKQWWGTGMHVKICHYVKE